MNQLIRVALIGARLKTEVMTDSFWRQNWEWLVSDTVPSRRRMDTNTHGRVRVSYSLVISLYISGQHMRLVRNLFVLRFPRDKSTQSLWQIPSSNALYFNNGRGFSKGILRKCALKLKGCHPVWFCWSKQLWTPTHYSVLAVVALVIDTGFYTGQLLKLLPNYKSVCPDPSQLYR